MCVLPAMLIKYSRLCGSMCLCLADQSTVLSVCDSLLCLPQNQIMSVIVSQERRSLPICSGYAVVTKENILFFFLLSPLTHVKVGSWIQGKEVDHFCCFLVAGSIVRERALRME